MYCKMSSDLRYYDGRELFTLTYVDADQEYYRHRCCSRLLLRRGSGSVTRWFQGSQGSQPKSCYTEADKEQPVEAHAARTAATSSSAETPKQKFPRHSLSAVGRGSSVHRQKCMRRWWYHSKRRRRS